MMTAPGRAAGGGVDSAAGILLAVFLGRWTGGPVGLASGMALRSVLGLAPLTDTSSLVVGLAADLEQRLTTTFSAYALSYCFSDDMVFVWGALLPNLFLNKTSYIKLIIPI